MRNHISMSMTPPGQDAPVRRSGCALTVLRKEADGQWRLARDANLLAAEK
jgi:ketosteroid isomerase-like protein